MDCIHFRVEAGVLVTTGTQQMDWNKWINPRRTELYDLENTNSYCDYSFDGPQVRGAVGGVITTEQGPKAMVCGGYNGESQSACYFLGNDQPVQNLNMALYASAAAVVGDGEFMWVTGGWHHVHGTQKLTNLVSEKLRADGQDLPTPLHGHCMVVFESNQVMVVGGHTGSAYSTDGYIYDVSYVHNSQLIATPRPHLTTGKDYFGCGVMTDYGTGAKVVLVIGGSPSNVHDIQRWNVGSAGNFEVKGQMPIPVARAASISHPSGVYLFGNDADQLNGAVVLKAYCQNDVCTGTTMTHQLQLNRKEPVAMLVPLNFANCTVAALTP